VRQTDVFIIRKSWGNVCVDRLRRQSQQSCALWRTSQALAGLGEMRCKLRLLRLFVCGLVEPIGIEPMT
jgi:hypothetical protein